MGVTLAGLKELGRLDVPYLVIHHASKSAMSGYMGSTSIGAHFRHLVSLDNRGELKISGNYVAGSALQLIRGDDGRTVRVETARPPSTTARKPERRASVEEEALAALSGAPTDALTSTGRAKEYLRKAVPGVTSDHHAKTVIQALERRGLVKIEGTGVRGSKAPLVITGPAEVREK